MSDKEIKAIKFKWQSHMSIEDEHVTVWVSECGRFGICDHVPFRGMSPLGRSYSYFRNSYKIFKAKQKFIEALRMYGHPTISNHYESFLTYMLFRHR